MPTYKPDLSKLSISQLSNLSGKSYTTVKRSLAGLEPVARDGKTLYFVPPEALTKIYRAAEESQRERLDRARAEKQELENKVAQGEYGPIEVLAWTLGDVASQIRAILTAIPKRLRQINPELKARELDLIRREISKTLNTIADVRPDFDKYVAPKGRSR